MIFRFHVDLGRVCIRGTSERRFFSGLGAPKTLKTRLFSIKAHVGFQLYRQCPMCTARTTNIKTRQGHHLFSQLSYKWLRPQSLLKNVSQPQHWRKTKMIHTYTYTHKIYIYISIYIYHYCYMNINILTSLPCLQHTMHIPDKHRWQGETNRLPCSVLSTKPRQFIVATASRQFRLRPLKV